MKSRIHNLVEKMTEALGPVFRAHPDYNDILQATCLVMARVLQSTPDRGTELILCEAAFQTTNEALIKFLDAEEAIQEARQNILAKGIDGFAKLVEPGSAADYPDNSDQPVSKTQKPFNPDHTLAAFNGGLGPESQAEAERFAGEDHSQEEGWANSPIHDEIARHEEAEAARQDTYKETD